MKKILVIEDHVDVRENIAEILTLAGYKVVEASNGKEGIRKARSEQPDLILCDIMMPELDGYGVYHILEEFIVEHQIPFLFLSAKSELKDLRKGMNMGIDDYITKPFEELDLLQSIEKRLSKAILIQDKNETRIIDEKRGFKKIQDAFHQESEQHYIRRQLLYYEGTKPRSVFYLVSGKIKLYRVNEYGKELITQLIFPGDLIGFEDVFKNTNYCDSAMVIENCSVLVMNQDQFMNLVSSDRNIERYMLKILANRLSDSECKMIQLAYDSVRARIAQNLISLAKHNDNNSLDITREDLAQMAGTSKESVIRTLSGFKQDQLLAFRDGKIQIINLEKLQQETTF